MVASVQARDRRPGTAVGWGGNGKCLAKARGPTARRGGARPPTPEGEHLHLEMVGPEEGKKGERGQG